MIIWLSKIEPLQRIFERNRYKMPQGIGKSTIYTSGYNMTQFISELINAKPGEWRYLQFGVGERALKFPFGIECKYGKDYQSSSCNTTIFVHSLNSEFSTDNLKNVLSQSLPPSHKMSAVKFPSSSVLGVRKVRLQCYHPILEFHGKSVCNTRVTVGLEFETTSCRFTFWSDSRLLRERRSERPFERNIFGFGFPPFSGSSIC